MKKSAFAFLLLLAASSHAKQPGLLDEITDALQAHTAKAPAAGLIESAFSPEGSAEDLVLKVINSSERSIRLAAYSFTSPAVVKALVSAERRGVDVRVIVDDKGNKARANIAALNLVVNAGVPARTISAYAIHHDKFIVSDERHVQTGSFNYSQAAAKSNSENVLVVWNNPQLAATYLQHWQSRWNQGEKYIPNY